MSRQSESRDRSGRKERVLHTRVSEELSEDIRRFAEEVRVPASNLVRNVLEEVFSVVESVSDDVGGVLGDLREEARDARQRILGQRPRRSGSERAARGSFDEDVERELRRDERGEAGVGGVGRFCGGLRGPCPGACLPRGPRLAAPAVEPGCIVCRLRRAPAPGRERVLRGEVDGAVRGGRLLRVRAPLSLAPGGSAEPLRGGVEPSQHLLEASRDGLLPGRVSGDVELAGAHPRERDVPDLAWA